MREIQLVNGPETLVDDEDYEALSRARWYPQKGRLGSVYALRTDGKSTRQMQRDLLDPEKVLPRSVVVDHINGNTLDNRRANLRLVDMSVSNINRRLFSNNKTGYRGVSIDVSRGRYQVGIKINGRSKKVGYFDTAEEAALAFNRAALAARGPEARLNVIPGQDDSDA